MRKRKDKTKKDGQAESDVEPDQAVAAVDEPAACPAADSAVDAEADTSEPVDEAAELRAKVEKLEDGLLRGRAEYQNFQRRAAVERAESIRYANAELMKSLLGVLDDFERSMSSAPGSSDAAAEGVRLVYENLLKALGEHGLESIDAVGRPFDPSIHEAMMQQPSADHPVGTVLEVFAKGYRLRDRVLRPSKVIVSQAVKDEKGDADGGDSAVEDGSSAMGNASALDGTSSGGAAVDSQEGSQKAQEQPQQ